MAAYLTTADGSTNWKAGQVINVQFYTRAKDYLLTDSLNLADINVIDPQSNNALDTICSGQVGTNAVNCPNIANLGTNKCQLATCQYTVPDNLGVTSVVLQADWQICNVVTCPLTNFQSTQSGQTFKVAGGASTTAKSSTSATSKSSTSSSMTTTSASSTTDTQSQTSTMTSASNTSTSTSQNSTAGTNNNDTNATPIIAGGIVGALVLIVLGALFWNYRRQVERRRRRVEAKMLYETEMANAPKIGAAAAATKLGPQSPFVDRPGGAGGAGGNGSAPGSRSGSPVPVAVAVPMGNGLPPPPAPPVVPVPQGAYYQAPTAYDYANPYGAANYARTQTPPPTALTQSNIYASPAAPLVPLNGSPLSSPLPVPASPLMVPQPPVQPAVPQQMSSEFPGYYDELGNYHFYDPVADAAYKNSLAAAAKQG
ncbi:hypothetical protein HDU76_012539 [Blyttiomyces sp. JEL0837]|nr:hypothetical protein HDU76_012539 [Blyttiomyces sp. JEL0837]